MTWMLTGGAGYIGAHIVRAFDAAGLPVVVLDNLSTGIRANVPPDVPFVQASVSDSEAVRAALREHRVTGVLHLAAQKAVAESVAKPLLYWDENVGGMRSLLQSCLDEGVDRVLFSSSAAVFGNPPVDFVTEETPVAPMSPYGETKLVGEWMLRDVAAGNWPALGGAALLQRRRCGGSRAGRPKRQQPGADDLPGADRGPQPAAVRRRLRHPRRLLHPRLHPRRRPGRGTRRRGRTAGRGPHG
jgi:UDP-glucose 4-epimerase